MHDRREFLRSGAGLAAGAALAGTPLAALAAARAPLPSCERFRCLEQEKS